MGKVWKNLQCRMLDGIKGSKKEGLRKEECKDRHIHGTELLDAARFWQVQVGL